MSYGDEPTCEVEDVADRTPALEAALRAEAERLGIDVERASTVDLAKLVGVIPDDVAADLWAAARENGWDPVWFMVLFIRPLFERDDDEEVLGQT